MVIKNFLIEGISGAGKTSICHELRRRGYNALNADQDLAYKGDPKTGELVAEPSFEDEADRVAWVHTHQTWHVDKVRATVDNRRKSVSFFCGDSRKFAKFIHIFNCIFMLNIDSSTLKSIL